MLRIMRTFDQIYLVFWIFIKIFSGKKLVFQLIYLISFLEGHIITEINASVKLLPKRQYYSEMEYKGSYRKVA
jgi:hypothetical protein